MKVIMILVVYFFLKVSVLIINEGNSKINISKSVQRVSYGMISFFMAQAIGMFS